MYLLFDIGGTKTRVAVSKDGRRLERVSIFETPKKAAVGIRIIAEAVEKLTEGKKIKAVAGGLAGSFDRRKTTIVGGGHNIKDWIGRDLKKLFWKEFRAPIFLENDAALAGLAEAVRGAGRGKEIVAYVTLSTGVGGARIVNGKVDASAMGFEPAYQIIDADGTMIPGHRRLGKYISGAALEERYGRAPTEIKDPAIQEKLSCWLAIGLNNMIVHWSPDVVVLGGPVMNIIPIKRVRFHLQKTLKSFMRPPLLRNALLGDTGGLQGALIYLRNYYGHN